MSAQVFRPTPQEGKEGMAAHAAPEPQSASLAASPSFTYLPSLPSQGGGGGGEEESKCRSASRLVRQDDLLLDSIHAAYRIGYEHGHAAGSLLVSIDTARAWLLRLADQQTRQAVALASAKGPGWAHAIAEQAQGKTERTTRP